MNRYLVSLSTITMLAAAAGAQCFETNFGTQLGNGDDTLFANQPLNFSFPMGGTFAAYTHIAANTNGCAFLWNAATGLVGGTSTGYTTTVATQVTNLRGAAGGAPRIAPFWRDLNLLPANNGALWLNNTTPGRCVVTWANAVQFGTTTPVFTVQAQLFATGEVDYFYSGTTATSAAMITGISDGGGIAAVPGVDLSAGGNVSATRLMFEQFTTFDLANSYVKFVPNAGGGYDEFSGVIPACANHVAYGAGCYNIAGASFYELFADSALASAALNGQSVQFVPTANGYTGIWGGGTFIPPSGGVVNLFASATDDGEAVVTPSIALPTPFGAQPSLRVHSNGVLSWGAAAQTFPGTQNYQPTAAGCLDAANAGIWFWHDYNEGETGSGRIVREEVVVGTDTVLVVTWNGVENYSSPTVLNPSTLQLQCNLTTGTVTVIWQSVDGNTTSTFGSAHLVGYSPAGSSFDPGSVALATALPITTTSDVPAMSLSASPPPVSTGTNGTLVTYTQSNVPEAAPASGVRLGVTIISLGQDLPGTDLGFLGMPGCSLHLTSLDLTIAFVDLLNNPVCTSQFVVPANVTPGLQLFAQSAALIVPNSLPNGQNAFGATLSNGVASTIQPQ